MKKNSLLSMFSTRFGWIIKGSKPSVESYLKDPTLLTHPSPTWFRLQRNGAIVGSIDIKLITIAKEFGLVLSPLISNTVPWEGFSAELFHDFITNQSAKRNFIHQLSSLSSKYEFSGINIDFEYFYASDEPSLIEFLGMLRDKIPNLIVSVDLPPLIDVKKTAWTYTLDARKVAPFVDFLIFMMYDYSWPKSKPGPICPLPWLRRNIDTIKKDLPIEKVVIGLPLYGYDWFGGNAKGISSESAEQIMKTYDCENKSFVGTEKESYEYFFEYTDNEGRKHTIYYQSRTAIRKRLKMLTEKGISGVSFWYWGAVPLHWLYTD